MRLAGQMKLGFFPIPAAAVERLTKFVVKSPGHGMHTIMDPCCGKGAALKQFADLLGIPEPQVYGMELDTRRGEAARELLPKAKIVSPSDFPSSKTSFGTISLCWLNPPYDDELGGGRREEARFLLKATDCLVRSGILMFAAPQRVIDSNVDIQRMLMQHYEDILMVPYPEDCRNYREMVVIAKRRKQFVNADDLSWRSCARSYWGGDPQEGFAKYVVPAVFDGPKSFEKGSYCDWEVVEKMASSPLKKMFDPPKPKPMPRPGLQLGAGQRALVLAGGFLNRTLTKFGQSILIKASPFKETYVKEQNTEEVYDPKSGESELKTTTVYSERICLKVRVLDEKGKIHDLK